MPHRGLLRQHGEHVGSGRVLYGFGRAASNPDVTGEAGRGDAEFFGFGLPARAEVGDGHAGLAAPGVDGGFSFHRCPLKP